ncbi:MAG: HD domain-containing protein [Clostridiaceae bacterium]
MCLYRVKQFLWSINAKIDGNDIEYVKKNLNGKEYDLFSRLSRQEQKHSIRVSRDVELECAKTEIMPKELIKVALLHDVGKVTRRLGSIDKAILVVSDRLSGGLIRKLENIPKINVYFNHGNIAYEVLKDFDLSERALYLIKNHHDRSIKGDPELDMLIKCDNRN